jgi:hypothetical protein
MPEILAHCCKWLFINVFCVFATPMIAQIAVTFESPRQYITHYTQQQIRIDGHADEADWLAIPWTDDFMDISGPDWPKPRFRTRTKILWNQDYLYVFAWMEEPHVWGNLRQRDTVIYYNNDFEVFLKPSLNSSHYYEIEVNALGTLWDLMLTRPYKAIGLAINFWNLDSLKVALHIDGTLNDASDVDRSWSVEMAIPLNGLMGHIHRNRPVQEGDLWRLNFSRVQWQHDLKMEKYIRKTDPATGDYLPEDNWVWSPQYVVDMHRPEMWGYLQFTERAAGSPVDLITDPWTHERQLLASLQWKQYFHKMEKHDFADNIETLGGPDFILNGTLRRVTFIRTTSGYELSLHVPGKGRLTLDHHGEFKIHDESSRR